MSQKKAYSFYSKKQISKKHFGMMLPDRDDHNSAENKYAALKPSPKSKAKGSEYLSIGTELCLLETVGAYAHVVTCSNQAGYVNISCLDTAKPGSVKVIQTSGLTSKEINVLLIIYFKCDHNGFYKIKSLDVLAGQIYMSRPTLDRALNRLDNLELIKYSKGDKLVLLKDYDKPQKYGYAIMSERMLTEEFFSLDLSSKRLILYLVSLQATHDIKVSYTKLKQVTRKNSNYKLEQISKKIYHFYTFQTYKNGLYFDLREFREPSIKKQIKLLGISFTKTVYFIKESKLKDYELSEEDILFLARIYKRRTPSDQLFKSLLNYAGEHYKYIQKKLPAYINGALDNHLITKTQTTLQ